MKVYLYTSITRINDLFENRISSLLATPEIQKGSHIVPQLMFEVNLTEYTVEVSKEHTGYFLVTRK